MQSLIIVGRSTSMPYLKFSFKYVQVVPETLEPSLQLAAAVLAQVSKTPHVVHPISPLILILHSYNLIVGLIFNSFNFPERL